MSKLIFFSPAVALLKKMKFPQKFILISLIFIIPLAYISISSILDRSQDIKHMNTARTGLEYIATLRPLAEHIAQTRGMTNAYLNGNTDIESKILQKRQRVDDEFKILTEKDEKFGRFFKTGNAVSTLHDRWKQLKVNAFTDTAPNVFSNYTNLINEILSLKLKIAESSGLILGKNLDSYYLVDSLVSRIPFIAETLGKSRGMGAGIAASKTLTNEKFLGLSAFLGDINTADMAMLHDFDIIFENNVDLKHKLENQLQQARQATRDFISLSKTELLDTEFITINPDDYFKAGTAAINKNLALYDTVLPLLDETLATRLDKTKLTQTIYISGLILVFLVTTYIFCGFYLSIMQTISNMVTSVNKMANGDLTVRFEEDTKDELNLIQQCMNSMVQKFEYIVSRVAKATEEVVAASSQTSANATQTAEATYRQNQQIEQIATAMEEMSATIQEVAKNTSNAADETRNVTEESINGQTIVNETIKTIHSLAEEMIKTRSVIVELETQSESISTVLDVIRGIADQTNLLALNAAIEAARAGEQGRGFAVVADEVRTLAGRTQESTEEINNIIENLQQGAQNAVNVIERNVERTNKTSEQANKAGVALDTIASAVANISNMNIQIASAVEEQAAVAEDTSHNVTNIHNISEETNKGSEENARVSKAMQDVANELKGLISEFKVA